MGALDYAWCVWRRVSIDQSILTLFKRLESAPSGRAFHGAHRSKPTLYRPKHHNPMCTLRSHTLEQSRGLYGSYTCMPVPSLNSVLESRERTESSSTSSASSSSTIVRPNHRVPKLTNTYHLPQHRPETTYKVLSETRSPFLPFFNQQCRHHFIHGSCFSLPSPSTQQPPSIPHHQNSDRFQEILRSSSPLPPPTPSMT